MNDEEEKNAQRKKNAQLIRNKKEGKKNLD